MVVIDWHLPLKDGVDGMSEKDAPIVSQPGEGEIVRIPLGRDIVIKASGAETAGRIRSSSSPPLSVASGRSHTCTKARKRVGMSSRVN